MIEMIAPNPSGRLFKLQKKLISQTGKAIEYYNMIEDGDRVMVCVSGGKDSYTLLSILIALQKRAPINFEIIAMNLDQKQPGFPAQTLPNFFKKYQVPFHIVTEDTYSIVKEKVPIGKITCPLCSRLRRGIIYKTAKDLKISKIALGHHKNDIVETFFMNMFHGSKLKAMPPKLLSDDKQSIVIRPLAFCEERDIEKFSNAMNFPIIPCNLCGSQENLERQNIKKMLNAWEKKNPGRISNIFKSLTNIELSHLADNNLFNFKGLIKDDTTQVDAVLKKIIEIEKI
jgi:tRNA 2-thiocytidine biosynthesis protein TtcA